MIEFEKDESGNIRENFDLYLVENGSRYWAESIWKNLDVWAFGVLDLTSADLRQIADKLDELNGDKK